MSEAPLSMMWCVWGLPLQPNKSMIGNACKTVSASVATCSNSSNKAMIDCSRHRLYLLNSWYIKGREGWWWWWWWAYDNFLINFPIRKKRKLLFYRIKTKPALFWSTLTIVNETLCSNYTLRCISILSILLNFIWLAYEVKLIFSFSRVVHLV